MMKRSRHKPRSKFIESCAITSHVAVTDQLPDLYCDLPDDLRRELPSNLTSASRDADNRSATATISSQARQDRQSFGKEES